MIGLKTKVEGFYKIEAVKKNGSKRLLANWFPNLITDQGLDRIGTARNYQTFCHVGSSSNTPAFTDTGLGSWIAFGNQESNTHGIQGDSPYYSWRNTIYKFELGEAAGNLAEVGVGWARDNGFLFSRALILDSQGKPTIITVLSDEYLYVTYQYRRYLCEVDTSGTVDIAGTTHGFVGRCARITSESYWPSIFYARDAQSYDCTLYDGNMGAIDGRPSGLYKSTGSFEIEDYVVGNRYIDWTYSFGPSQGNLTEGASALLVNMCGGSYQFRIIPKIFKTSDDVLSLTFRASWDRS